MKQYSYKFFLIIVVMLFGATALSQAATQEEARDESMRKGETRETVDPSFYASDLRVQKAYQIAKEIPWVLDSIYCYCMCKESPAFRHKSLLSCFVDDHAAV
jgi:hypothetical protein